MPMHIIHLSSVTLKSLRAELSREFSRYSSVLPGNFSDISQELPRETSIPNIIPWQLCPGWLYPKQHRRYLAICSSAEGASERAAADIVATSPINSFCAGTDAKSRDFKAQQANNGRGGCGMSLTGLDSCLHEPCRTCKLVTEAFKARLGPYPAEYRRPSPPPHARQKASYQWLYKYQEPFQKD